VHRAEAQVRNSSDSLERMEPLLPKEFVTPDKIDQARTAKLTAQAALDEARQKRDQAERDIGNLLALEAEARWGEGSARQGRLDLSFCTVRAPFDARVVNLHTAIGQLVAPGPTPVFSLVDARAWYVVANYRETQLAHIAPGMEADLYLLTDPRHHFRGTVPGDRLGREPADQPISPGLPKIGRELQWVHIAQRFPVRIRIDDPRPPELFRVGASAGRDRPQRVGGPLRRRPSLACTRMTTSPIAAAETRSQLHARWNALLAFLRRELAPFPGRATATLRITIASVVVLVLCMVLRVPEAYLSVWIVLRVATEESGESLLAGILAMLALTVGPRARARHVVRGDRSARAALLPDRLHGGSRVLPEAHVRDRRRGLHDRVDLECRPDGARLRPDARAHGALHAVAVGDLCARHCRVRRREPLHRTDRPGGAAARGAGVARARSRSGNRAMSRDPGRRARSDGTRHLGHYAHAGAAAQRKCRASGESQPQRAMARTDRADRSPRERGSPRSLCWRTSPTQRSAPGFERPPLAVPGCGLLSKRTRFRNRAAWRRWSPQMPAPHCSRRSSSSTPCSRRSSRRSRTLRARCR
jgi:hypothetical protein